MAVKKFTDDNFQEEVLEISGAVLVDYYADWCGPCKMAAPIIEDLAEEYEGKVTIGKLDVDENQQMAAKFGVMSIPTVIMFKDGEEVDRLIGFRGREGYEDMIKEQAK